MDYKQDLNSDDDFDCSNGYNENYSNGGAAQSRLSNPNGLSKAELRKTNKPIMEKRRRARINHCLNELKSLILEAMKKDPARHTKLEKADILEMTVKHLQSVQRQQLNMAIQTDPSVVHKFKTGFVECAEEVNRYVGQLDGIDAAVRQRLTNHLNNCANSLEQIGSMSNFNNGYRGQQQQQQLVAATQNGLFAAHLAQDLNNNNNNNNGNTTTTTTAQPITMGGLQLIPSRLPSGEFALIMPNSNATAAAAPFAWPTTAATTASTGNVNAATLNNLANPNHLNDYANSFRMSAFSKPQQQQQQQHNQFSVHTKLPTTHAAAVAYAAAAAVNNSTHGAYATHNGASVAAATHTHATSPPLSPVSSISSHGDDSLIMQTHCIDYPTSQATVSELTANNSFSGVFSTPPPTSAETSFTSLNTSSSSSTNTSISSSSSRLSLTLNLQQSHQVSSTSGVELNASLKRERDNADSSDSCAAEEHVAKKQNIELTNDKSAAAWRPW